MENKSQSVNKVLANLSEAKEILQNQVFAAINDPDYPMAVDYMEISKAKSLISEVEFLFPSTAYNQSINSNVSVEKMAEEILEGYPDWRFPDGVVMIEKSDVIAAMVEMYQASKDKSLDYASLEMAAQDVQSEFEICRKLIETILGETETEYTDSLKINSIRQLIIDYMETSYGVKNSTAAKARSLPSPVWVKASQRNPERNLEMEGNPKSAIHCRCYGGKYIAYYWANQWLTKMNVNSEELSPIPDSWLNDWEWFDESALPVNSELLEALGKIETGLYQISLGTHGFEEATTYSKYASEKAKGLRKILKAAIQKEKPNNEK